MRRQAQLLARRPDARVVNIRGNVEARLAALDAGEVDALILAKAGLDRLAESRADIHPIPLDDMLPGAAQGHHCPSVAPTTAATAILDNIDDRAARHCVAAERALLDVVDESLQSTGPGGRPSPPTAAEASCGANWRRRTGRPSSKRQMPCATASRSRTSGDAWAARWSSRAGARFRLLAAYAAFE